MIRIYRAFVYGKFRNITEEFIPLKTDAKGNIWLLLSITNISVDSGIGKGGNKKKQNLYSDSDYKRFDVLVGGGAGVELMHRVRFSVGYNAGLLNRTSTANSTLKRNQLHIGVAFVF